MKFSDGLKNVTYSFGLSNDSDLNPTTFLLLSLYQDKSVHRIALS